MLLLKCAQKKGIFSHEIQNPKNTSYGPFFIIFIYLVNVPKFIW